MNKVNRDIKIAVAMSGGVDSSVAAGLCVEKYGKENVFGVTMKLFCYGGNPSIGTQDLREKSCCSLDAINDAKAVCEKLGIAHYVIDAEKEFKKAVIANFISEYKKGRTPIPCIPCNTVIKFDYLLKKVQGLGANILATGHYSRVATLSLRGGEADAAISKSDRHAIARDDGVGYKLFKGVDKTKDQSYFLYGLNQKQLAHTLFPLGGMKKTEVRKLAAKMKLKTAQKRESQGICFVTEGRVTDWMRDKVKIKPGKIVDTKGKIVGEHEGIIFYTVGQRKRIPGGYPEPMYVVRIDAKNNQVVIGTKKDLYSKELMAEKVHWIAGVAPKLPLRCKAKIRYNMTERVCSIVSLRGGGTDAAISKPDRRANARDDNFRVIFSKPQRAITPGQSIVFYTTSPRLRSTSDKGQVLGGGIINSDKR